MTTTTSSTPQTTASPAAARPAPGVPAHDTLGAGFVTTSFETAKRTLKQFFRTPQILFMGTIQGALFLFMFRYVFGGAIGRVGDGGAISYVDFLVPGFLVTTILWTGMGAASGVAEDSSTGVYDRLRSLPIPRPAVMFGRSMADTGLVAWGMLITGILGFVVGFRTHSSPAEVALGFVLMVAAGWAFTWVFMVMGLVSGNAQAAQGMSMLVVPFSFVSAANVPVSTMPGWMQPFAANQPVSVVCNAVRSLMLGGPDRIGIGHSTQYWIVLSLAWSLAIAAVFGTLAVRLFAKTR